MRLTQAKFLLWGVMLVVPRVVGADASHVSTDAPLDRVRDRLSQETQPTATEPNSAAFLKAVGQGPVRTVTRHTTFVKRTLDLPACLQEAFVRNNQIRQVREGILAVGGSQLIANSRFLPTIDIVTRFEQEEDQGTDQTDDLTSMNAVLSQRLLEYGKDNPIDVSLRREQRETLFAYEDTVARIFSDVRRAFYGVLLKQQQIATRQALLEQFQRQYERKQQRLEAGNLSVKIEVLTARLNVLNEQTRINSLQRQWFNRKMDLLRLVGLPVGAETVQFRGEPDTFGLNGFDLEGMINLALVQSSQVALAEVLVAEQGRVLDQLKYEYLPDVSMIAGYQDRHGRVGTTLDNVNDTWGLDVFTQAGAAEGRRDMDGLGYFAPQTSVAGPDPGWFAAIQARIPVFEGRAREGRRIQSRTYLQRLRAALADSKDVIELSVRKNFRLLAEQQFQVELAQENVAIEKERFSIQEQLRDVGRIDDDALERFRENFFQAQDALFSQQEILIERQEDLREAVRIFR